MTHLIVLHEPDDRLRIVSAPIDPSEITQEATRTFIRNLKQTMRLEDGVGIAAPQVNVHKRIIIVDLPERGPSAFFNPEIIERSFKTVESVEGCLSVPECSGIVNRHRSVTVRAYNEQAEEETLKLQGFPAIVFQHEIDHLDGVLFIDRATNIRKAR